MNAAELRGGSKPSLHEALGWIGSRVDDIYGANVGRLEDVWIDPGTGVPRWILVKEGRFGGRTTLIPFEDATAGAGHVWVPYEREVVREAPEIESGAPLTHQVEAALRIHYTASAPAAISHRGQPPPPPVARQPESAMGSATVPLHGPPEAGFEPSREHPHGVPQRPPPQAQPQPQRQVLRERPRPEPQFWQTPPQAYAASFPPVQLPPRPAPPIAGPQPSPQQPAAQPPQPPYAPQQQASQPPQPPYAPQQRPGWQMPQPQPPQPGPPAAGWAPQAAQSPAEVLRDLAASSDVHYVEIELSGELSIRGELRSVRVVPRGPGTGRLR